MDRVYCNTIIHLKRIMVTLFAWIITFNGLLNLDCSVTHWCQKIRVNDDSTTYLWHCRLSHVSINCMKRLHADGSLYSLDFESLVTCKSYHMSKALFSLRWNKIVTCWKWYILMYAVQWVLRHAVDIIMFLLHWRLE